MNIISQTSSIVTTNTYVVLTRYGRTVYIEHLNDKGKLIDCDLRSINGQEIDDPALLEEIQEFIDKKEMEKSLH